MFTARERDTRYTKFIINKESDFTDWRFQNLIDAYAEANGMLVKDARKEIKEDPHKIDDFVIENAERVIRTARPDYNAVGQRIRELIDLSKTRPKDVMRLEREDHSDFYVINGERILFYADKLKVVDGKYVSGEPLTTLWDDLLSNNLHKEGGVSFPKGKKPEFLIKRCLELSTQKGDLVLDSFAGSGTTGAVAQKMGRRWIMAELRDQAESHILPRIRSVIDGKDTSGVTAATKWKGGGGFRYFRLAPSLLEKDTYGNWIISKEYKPEMLAEAMCKHMGFTYAPSQNPEEYWNHGYSTETDFIFVTTQNLTHQALAKIAEDVGPDRSLLVCCKAFNANAESFENLTIQKIPHAVLKKCEWGRDDYSLNVANLPMAAEDEDDTHPSMPPDDLPLFATQDAGEEE